MTGTDNSTPHASVIYDDEILKTIPYFRQFHLETIDLVRTVRPDVRIWLDTGTGTGYLPEQALPQFPQTRFLLADPAPAMLDAARVRLARFAPHRIGIVGPLSSEQLGAARTETPQVVTAIQCHHYGGLEPRRRATFVIQRLLAPGGLYVTFENIRPDTPKGVEIALDRWLSFQRQAGRTPEQVEEHRRRFDRNYFPITVAEHLELLREAGFVAFGNFWLSQMQGGFYGIK